MLAEASRSSALTSETVGIFAGSMWVSELPPPSIRVVTGLSKKTSAKYFCISLIPSIFLRFSGHKLCILRVLLANSSQIVAYFWDHSPQIGETVH